MNAGSAEKIPRWNLSSLYGGFEDRRYAADKQRFRAALKALSKLAGAAPTKLREGARWTSACIEAYNKAADLYEQLSAFAYVNYSTNTGDKTALKEMNELDGVAVALHRAMADFRNGLAGLKQAVPRLVAADAALKPYAFFLRESLKLQKKQMSPDLEELAADLSRYGGDAWSRLQQKLSSTLAMPWAEEETKTVVQLRNLAYDSDRSVREKAYRLELEAWKKMEEPLAAALNGVKGFSVCLDGRRGYADSLERAVMQARITPATLDSLIGVLTDSLPIFRRYLKLKARVLGQTKLAFYDLFAPVTPYIATSAAAGMTTRHWSFHDAAAFIIEKFGGFSAELGAFAKRAFESGWIDAEPRQGKVGGAYCIDFPLTGESRILTNFENTIYSVTTTAHELGHAWHHQVLKDQPHALRAYPMTLAETASIFSEMIVFAGALEKAIRIEKIALIENFLQDVTQVIVDILSRFLFEKELFEKRREEEPSPADLCAMMIRAQKATYGDGLNEKLLHPYMWAAKGHYYNPDRAFYNFPYAFGQLFGLALYERYRAEGAAFPERYKRILQETGRESANEVARRAGCNIEERSFWKNGIKAVERYLVELEGMIRT